MGAAVNLIETICERIANNNRPVVAGRMPFTPGDTRESYDTGLLDGRIEAYEDVLYLLGFYDEERQPRYKRIEESDSEGRGEVK